MRFHGPLEACRRIERVFSSPELAAAEAGRTLDAGNHQEESLARVVAPVGCVLRQFRRQIRTVLVPMAALDPSRSEPLRIDLATNALRARGHLHNLMSHARLSASLGRFVRPSEAFHIKTLPSICPQPGNGRFCTLLDADAGRAAAAILGKCPHEVINP
jgi:hypothetical protein